MSGRWTVGDRIITGTNNLASQLNVWLACRELDGKAVKGKERAKAVLARSAGGFVVAWFLGGIMYALGVIWWAPVGLWVLSALVASSAPEPAQPITPKAAPPLPAAAERARAREREALLYVLADITQGRSGIHLMRLYERMREWPAYASSDDRTLRDLLTAHLVPIHKSVTADRISGRSGIKAADIQALMTPPPPQDTPIDTTETAVDLHESRSLSPLSPAQKG